MIIILPNINFNTIKITNLVPFSNKNGSFRLQIKSYIHINHQYKLYSSVQKRTVRDLLVGCCLRFRTPPPIKFVKKHLTDFEIHYLKQRGIKRSSDMTIETILVINLHNNICYKWNKVKFQCKFFSYDIRFTDLKDFDVENCKKHLPKTKQLRALHVLTKINHLHHIHLPNV